MPGWHPRFLVLSAILTTSLLLMPGCGGSSPTTRTGDGATAVDALAQRDLDLIQRELQLERFAAVMSRGAEALDARADHPLGDAITVLMIKAASSSGRLEAVRDLALDFPRRWPRSVRRDGAMLEAAQTLADADRTQDALRVVAVLAEAQPAGATREFTVSRAADWLQSLSGPELMAWVQGDGPLAPTAGLVTVRRNLAQADLEMAAAGLAELERRYPLASATERAQQALAAARAQVELAATGRLGVLCPLTGRYARFGNAFLQGVRLAADHVPTVGEEPWDLLFEDTEADPVLAALRARRLCEDEGCGLLMGGLLSATTATAALVAADHGVSLISPTATSERLSLLGSHVLQTNQTGPLEAELLARLACEVLLKRRFAIIRPDTPEGESMAAAFATKVEDFGGEVVGTEVIDPASTDFRAEVRSLRAMRAEVVFAPTTADQMTLLGPQLDFFKVGALVLGPSGWNSQRLLDRAGTVLERAVFVASEVAYPVDWSVDFTAAWPAVDYDEETTAVGRSAYLAARLALETLAGEPGLAASDVALRMHDALTGQQAEAGPEAYGSSVRMVRAGEVAPFPGELYTVAWQREQALADSLAAADSLGVAAALDSLLSGEGAEDF